MPYEIQRDGEQHCVVNSETGERVACHDTEDGAKQHMAALYANEPSAKLEEALSTLDAILAENPALAAKAGAAISRSNMARVQAMHDHTVAMGAECQMSGPDMRPIGKSAKALDSVDEESYFADVSVKALGDRQLELRVAWGWDNHREQFHPTKTDFDLDNFPTPPVAYYHGYTEHGKPAPKPVYIGKTIKRENREDGHYLIAKLNKKPEADRVWAAALKGEAVVSPGTAGHLRRRDPDGTLTYWPIVEISAWDGTPDRRQAHPESRAFPVLKALYDEAGLSLPAPLSPEAAGDAASASVDIDSDEAARYIVTQVTSAVLASNTTRKT